MKKHIYLSATIAALALLAAGAMVISAEPAGLSQDLADLASSDPSTRTAAIKKLEQGSPALASALIDELDQDHPPVVKGAIAQIVRKIGPASADAADLKADLRSTEAPVRHAAAVILQANPTLATKALADTATDASELSPIRCAAAIALGGAGASANSTLASLVDDATIPASLRACAMQALCQTSASGSLSIRKLAENTTRTRGDRLAAVRALGAATSKGHKELTSLATAPWAFVRERALDVIAGTKDATLLKTVAGRMADGSAGVRAAALRTTIGLGGEVTHKATIKGLIADADPRVQVLAIQSVARSYAGTPLSVQLALRAQLASANFRVRYEAAMALYAHGDKTGAATMNADKNTPNLSQAQLASRAYSQITGK